MKPTRTELFLCCTLGGLFAVMFLRNFITPIGALVGVIATVVFAAWYAQKEGK